MNKPFPHSKVCSRPALVQRTSWDGRPQAWCPSCGRSLTLVLPQDDSDDSAAHWRDDRPLQAVGGSESLADTTQATAPAVISPTREFSPRRTSAKPRRRPSNA